MVGGVLMVMFLEIVFLMVFPALVGLIAMAVPLGMVGVIMDLLGVVIID